MEQLVSLLNLGSVKADKVASKLSQSPQQEGDDRFQTSLDEAFETIKMHGEAGTQISAKAVVSSRSSKEQLAEEKEIRDIKSIKDIKDIVRLAGEKKLGLKSLTVEIKQAGGTDKKLVIRRDEASGKEAADISLTAKDPKAGPKAAAENSAAGNSAPDTKKIDLKELIAQLDQEKSGKETPTEKSDQNVRNTQKPEASHTLSKQTALAETETAEPEKASVSKKPMMLEETEQRTAKNDTTDPKIKTSPGTTAKASMDTLPTTEEPSKKRAPEPALRDAEKQPKAKPSDLPHTLKSASPAAEQTNDAKKTEPAAETVQSLRKEHPSQASEPSGQRAVHEKMAEPNRGPSHNEASSESVKTDVSLQKTAVTTDKAIPAQKTDAQEGTKTETLRSDTETAPETEETLEKKTDTAKRPVHETTVSHKTSSQQQTAISTENDTETPSLKSKTGETTPKTVEKKSPGESNPVGKTASEVRKTDRPTDNISLKRIDEQPLPEPDKVTNKNNRSIQEKPATDLARLLNKLDDDEPTPRHGRSEREVKKPDTKQTTDTTPADIDAAIPKQEPRTSAKTAASTATVRQNPLASNTMETVTTVNKNEKRAHKAAEKQPDTPLPKTVTETKSADSTTLQKEQQVKPAATLSSLIANQKAEAKEIKENKETKTANKPSAAKTESEIRPLQTGAPAPAADEFMRDADREFLSRMVSQNLSASAAGVIKSDPVRAEMIQNAKTGMETALESISQNETRGAEDAVQDVAKSDDVKTETVKNRVATARATINHFVADMKERIENYRAPLMKLTLDLNPKNLGSVGVTLLNRGKNLHVQIHSNNQAIQLFMQNHADFRNALGDLGFKDVQLNFSSGQGSSAGHNGGGSNSGYQQDQSSPYYGNDGESSNESEEMEIILPNMIYG